MDRHPYPDTSSSMFVHMNDMIISPSPLPLPPPPPPSDHWAVDSVSCVERELWVAATCPCVTVCVSAYLVITLVLRQSIQGHHDVNNIASDLKNLIVN